MVAHGELDVAEETEEVQKKGCLQEPVLSPYFWNLTGDDLGSTPMRSGAYVQAYDDRLTMILWLWTNPVFQ
ncbi:hypothetical protein RUM43_002025 [Polyplax serrata]|uniref:Uncharacterized protein n=1 Tax=Polyplax serrata TaxID=468196 RepID=A0AAN8PBZ7_POLSC